MLVCKYLCLWCNVLLCVCVWGGVLCVCVSVCVSTGNRARGSCRHGFHLTLRVKDMNDYTYKCINVSKNTLNGQTECLAQTYGTVLLNMSTKDQELTHMI